VTEYRMGRARVERLLVEVVVSIYDRLQAEDHAPLLSAQGRLDLEAAAPGIVRELDSRAIAKLDAACDDVVRAFLRSKLEPAYRRSAAAAGLRPS
jgi:hypothetical protein